VRASFHVFNDDQDLDRLISGVKRILAEGNHDASG
jgi:selenocysteine lyase/cysteine desulfurase